MPSPHDVHWPLLFSRPIRRRKGRPSGWTVASLTELRALNRDLDGDLHEVAAAMGETRRECDRALNAMLGRTPEQALKHLEKGRAA